MTAARDSLNMPSMRLAILLLAAGEGSRLGGYPKALLKRGGESLLKRFYLSAQHLRPIEFKVVTGFYSEAIESEVRSLNQEAPDILLECICNPSPELGQSSSVRLGLESMKSEFDILMIALCDQPNVGAPEMESLLKQFSHRPPDQEMILPLVHGQRGNPVLFSKKVVDDILKIPGMVPRAYMDRHPGLVKTFETGNQAYILDVDTKTDIQKLGLDAV